MLYMIVDDRYIFQISQQNPIRKTNYVLKVFDIIRYYIRELGNFVKLIGTYLASHLLFVHN